MAEFTPINTQEEFDAAISSRLKRERESLTKSLTQKFAEDGYLSPDAVSELKAGYDKQIGELNTAIETANKKAAAYDKDIAEKDAAIKKYETASVKARIAHETGLPYELAGRLSGESEEDIRKDAQLLVKLVGDTNRRSDPLSLGEPGGNGHGNKADAAYKALAESLTKH